MHSVKPFSILVPEDMNDPGTEIKPVLGIQLTKDSPIPGYRVVGNGEYWTTLEPDNGPLASMRDVVIAVHVTLFDPYPPFETNSSIQCRTFLEDALLRVIETGYRTTEVSISKAKSRFIELFTVSKEVPL